MINIFNLHILHILHVSYVLYRHFQNSTVTFENVCGVHTKLQHVQLLYVYHCCLCLIFDQTTFPRLCYYHYVVLRYNRFLIASNITHQTVGVSIYLSMERVNTYMIAPQIF